MACWGRTNDGKIPTVVASSVRRVDLDGRSWKRCWDGVERYTIPARIGGRCDATRNAACRVFAKRRKGWVVFFKVICASEHLLADPAAQHRAGLVYPCGFHDNRKLMPY
jgi:hypothetical protein